MNQWKVAFLSGFLAAFGLLIILLGRDVILDLEALATAQTDDIRWNMSQLEVELLRVQLAAQDPPDQAEHNLAAFRQRYDIFYSRVATLTQSPLHRAVRNDPQAAKRLTSAWTFLEEFTPLVDGPDVALIAGLPRVRARLDMLLPDIRGLALIGVENSVRRADLSRNDISSTLTDLAVAVFGLILALTFTIFVLVRLFKRGQIVSNENKIVKSRFEAAVSSSLDAVLVVDISGQIIEFNGAAEAVFGYARDQALGQDMVELLVPPEQRSAHKVLMRKFLKTGGKSLAGGGRIRLEAMRKSGEVFPVELTISLAQTEEQAVFVSFLRDITNELKAEEELRSARDKAQAGEKAKSDLLTVMSHEMRTPLNGILGSLSLIQKEKLTKRQMRHLNSIGVSGELLLSHVNDVLDLSRLDAKISEPRQVEFDLPQMVTRLVESLRGNAKQHRNSVTTTLLCAEELMVRGYQTELQQCLVNLIGNAIKFNRDSEVTVEVEQLPQSNIFEFRVSDNGVGISGEDLDRIFDEFVTIDTAYARENQGTGLGLAITKRLVKAMGGDIEVDSIEGEGSLFSFRVPLRPVAGQSVIDPETHETETGASLAGKSALVVEDNDINRMILTDMLNDLGCDVTEASDGYQGVEAAALADFDILLLDISMPGLDGIETLARIRSQAGAAGNTVAIAVTAHAALSERNRFLAAHFVDVLVKPVAPELLEEKVLAALTIEAKLPAGDDYEDVTAQFIERFGQEMFDKSFRNTMQEVAELLQALALAQDLPAALIEDAHRLAGSTAILGFTELREALQLVEVYDGRHWPSDKHSHLENLQSQVQKLCVELRVQAPAPTSDHMVLDS